MAITGYTQVNHNEPTNDLVKETTVTTQSEDLNSPGIEDKDILWDHVGGFIEPQAQYDNFTVTSDGYKEIEAVTERNVSTDSYSDNTVVNNNNITDAEYFQESSNVTDSVNKAIYLGIRNITENVTNSSPTKESLVVYNVTTDVTTEIQPTQKSTNVTNVNKTNEKNITQNRNADIPELRTITVKNKHYNNTIRKMNFTNDVNLEQKNWKGSTVLGNRHQNLPPYYNSKSLNVSKSKVDLISKPKLPASSIDAVSTNSGNEKIIYNPTDPFSVIFGEVKTEFYADKNRYNGNGNFTENIRGGIMGVKDILRNVTNNAINSLIDNSSETYKKLKSSLSKHDYKTFIVQNFQEESDKYGSEQEEREMQRNDTIIFGKKKISESETLDFHEVRKVTEDNKNSNLSKFKYSHEFNDNKDLFKEWDTASEEQEKMLEEMVSDGKKEEKISKVTEQLPPTGSRWFVLLLAGNSTIVKLRQRDFAKYLKLNLAARLSLEYDDVRVNKVILAPPRLMVNVSVVPSGEGGMDDIDEELDIEDKIFGEEEAPLHKLAETNATLLELSGEEYHVVRFLSLRSQQPATLEDTPSATSVIVNDRHSDIELVIYVTVGGACALVILATALIALFRYLRTAQINWPWKRPKPSFLAPWSLQRHQRMADDSLPSIGGPLTVIYSGNFNDRSCQNSGSWIEDFQIHPSVNEDHTNSGPRSLPVYGFGALSNNALPEICETNSAMCQESPRFNLDSKLHILGCRPNHMLLPHQPSRLSSDHKSMLDVRIPSLGVDNPNYQT